MAESVRRQGRKPARLGWARRNCMAVVLAVVCGFGSFTVAAQSVEVLANASVDREYLTRNYLRSVFTLRVRTWPDGQAIRIFVLDDADATHTSFCRDILGTYPYVLRRTWDRSTFTGTAMVPARVASADEMRRMVLATPGAVGYVPEDVGGDSAQPPIRQIVLGINQ